MTTATQPATSNFRKVVRLGTARTYANRAYSIYCEIEYKDGRLSISGVEGPTASGNAIGSCGQIDTHLRNEQDKINLAPGWTRSKVARFFSIWQRWHLSDMRADPDSDGYKYGHGWKREEVPANVLEFLRSLPNTDKTPAWV